MHGRIRFALPGGTIFSRLPGSLRLRLLVGVILFSTVVTLTLTGFQLYFDYRRGVTDIETRLEDIHQGYRGSLSEGLWRLDRQYLQVQLDGIARLPDIRAVEVRESSAGPPFVVHAGRRTAGAIVARTYPLRYTAEGDEQRVGTLYVEATLADQYRDLMRTALTTLLTQGLRIFFIALFIIYLVHHLVTRHLSIVAQFVRAYDVRRPPAPLRLPRAPPRDEDELDQVVNAFNAMCDSLERAYADLREQDAHIRRLVDSNIIGVFFWNLSGAILSANKALVEMIGYQQRELLSGQVRWTDITPPEYRAVDAQARQELLDSGSCRPYEKEYIRKDGSRIPVLLGAALFEQSRETGVAFVLDLTERKRAEAEREARHAAEAANRAKSAFLANMSHELRSPLNGILGFAQILERDPALGERQLAGVNVIKTSGEHLLTLINDILDLAKIEAGKITLAQADFRLAPFVQSIADLVGVKAIQKGLALACEPAPDLPHSVRTDEKRLRQVLLNLLSNAIKFTDRGQIVLRARFTPPARLGFEVQDTGIGIAPEQLQSIFEPFEQAGDPQRRLTGTGLGLAISRQYVRLMGGEIQVESRPGVGSSFRFEIDAPAVQASTTEPATRNVTGYLGPRRTVLVVDDLASNRAVASGLLTPLGFEVVEAADGSQGLELAQRLRPDLILMDITMPELDGLAVTRRLRQLEAFRDVPILALSASVSASDSAQCIAAGMNAFLPKPLDANRLLEQMAQLLQLEWMCGPAPEPVPREDAATVAPPPPEMDVLYQLARMGDMHAIIAQAERLANLDETYRPFAARLDTLARGYQSKALLRLVEQYRRVTP